MKKKVRFPFTSQHVVDDGEPDTFLVRIQKSEIILPGECLNIKIPKTIPSSQQFAIESRDCKLFETPLVIESVGYNMKIPNSTQHPIVVKKNSHLQVRKMKIIDTSSTELKHEYPKKPNLCNDVNLNEVSIDPSKKLFTAKQVD